MLLNVSMSSRDDLEQLGTLSVLRRATIASQPGDPSALPSCVSETLIINRSVLAKHCLSIEPSGSVLSRVKLRHHSHLVKLPSLHPRRRLGDKHESIK